VKIRVSAPIHSPTKDASFEVPRKPNSPSGSQLYIALLAANMRQTCVFSGSSHPLLVESICERLGQQPAKVDLRKFSNGETSVEISQ